MFFFTWCLSLATPQRIFIPSFSFSALSMWTGLGTRDSRSQTETNKFSNRYLCICLPIPHTWARLNINTLIMNDSLFHNDDFNVSNLFIFVDQNHCSKSYDQSTRLYLLTLFLESLNIKWQSKAKTHLFILVDQNRVMSKTQICSRVFRMFWMFKIYALCIAMAICINFCCYISCKMISAFLERMLCYSFYMFNG